MLIVSKTHDYYDVGMNNGVDKTVVYNRSLVEIEGRFPQYGKYVSDGEWQGAVLGFCGKFYPFMFRSFNGKIDTFIWSVEEALKFATQSKRKRWYSSSLSSEIEMKQFFDKKYPELEELFHKHRAPIFGFEPAGRIYSWTRNQAPYRTLVLNPSLKDIQFYKVKDPITAFQDIYMFMSGVLGAPPKPPEPISDKIMAASKGHDGEYSFRKPPGKRGKNRWR